MTQITLCEKMTWWQEVSLANQFHSDLLFFGYFFLNWKNNCEMNTGIRGRRSGKRRMLKKKCQQLEPSRNWEEVVLYKRLLNWEFLEAECVSEEKEKTKLFFFLVKILKKNVNEYFILWLFVTRKIFENIMEERS